jgi:hypothetical protein
MTLHVFVYTPNDKYKRAQFTPKTKRGDVIIFIKSVEDEEVNDEYVMFTVVDGSLPYNTRGNINTIFDSGDVITADSIREIEGSAKHVQVYNLVNTLTDYNISRMVSHFATVAGEEVQIPRLTTLKNMAESDSELPEVLFEIVVTPSPEPADRQEESDEPEGHDDDEAFDEEEDSDLEAVDETVEPAYIGPRPPIGIDSAIVADTTAGIISLINIIDPAIKYLGFNPKIIRSVFIGRSATDEIIARDLILCFAAYAHIANNITKLNTKRINVDISKRVMEAIQAMGVMKKATQKDHLTLPRIAIAFMPEYLIYRRFMTIGLQNQTESTINVVFKDIIFHGCETISSKAGYQEFHKEFSALIYKPKEETDISDAKFLANYNRWSKVTKSGYRNDIWIHPRMTMALNASFANKTVALNSVIEGIAYYRTEV